MGVVGQADQAILLRLREGVYILPSFQAYKDCAHPGQASLNIIFQDGALSCKKVHKYASPAYHRQAEQIR